MIYKSGAEDLPANYRPITIIPFLYKVFAKLLYARVVPILSKEQPPEQAGFRSDYSTADHMLTFTVLYEKCQEWDLPIWVAALDFRKAFDMVEHDALWEALAKQNVPAPYTRLLCRMYSGQTGQVKTDKRSRAFKIERGTKQGDPLSSLLFNALLEDIFRDAAKGWEKKHTTVKIGMHSLTNLRFADDVMLLAKTLPQLTRMLEDVVTESGKRGLLLHPDKTKIISNTSRRTGRNAARHVEVKDLRIEVLPKEGSIKYLGRMVSFDSPHAEELHHRTEIAWRKFMALKKDLITKSYPLRHRLKLFDAVITPTALYGCQAWTLTKAQEEQLKRAERRMLRMMLGTARRTATDPLTGESSLEPWVDFMHRSTADVEKRIEALDIERWDCQYRRRKWRWAGELLRGNSSKWSHKLLVWMPECEKGAKRYQGRPARRWEDCFCEYLRGRSTATTWCQIAQNQELWSSLEDGFARHHLQ